jgi:predicted aldo/keto reductase-like oxidoreductase
MFGWAAEQKAKGALRHVGFSFHGTTELLEHVLTTHPEMEFVLLQLNYIDVLRGKAGELHETARRHNKPVIVMEPVKGGSLAALPPNAEAILKAHSPESSIASWAIRYAASLPGATCVLSGMSTVAQMEDNLKTYNPFKPITAQELEILEKALMEISKISTIPCTYCKYCIADCPQNIEIATCFSLYNDIKRGAEGWNVQMLYGAVPPGQRAGDCINCGVCVPRCPQHIDIPKHLETVAARFE